MSDLRPGVEELDYSEDSDVVQRVLKVEARGSTRASAKAITYTRQKSLLTFSRPHTVSVDLTGKQGFFNQYRVVTRIKK